jgi:C1A family cysteine protease
MAMAYIGFSKENKTISAPTDHKFIHKDVTNQTRFSTNVKLAPENPKFIEYKSRKLIYQATQSPTGHKSGLSPSPVDLSHLKHTSVPDIYASVGTSISTSYDLRTLNKVTPTKNQLTCGLCWVFATDGSLESYLTQEKPGTFQKIILKTCFLLQIARKVLISLSAMVEIL